MTRVNTGFEPIPYPESKTDNPHVYFSMGTTAENVAKKYNISRNKVPYFPESLGLIEAKVEKKIKSGDHTIIICLITNYMKLNTKKPLIYYKSKYHSI